MEAFTNTPITKKEFVKNLKWHQEQDAFVAGAYDAEDGLTFKGCAVGCSIHSIQLALKTKEDLKYSDHSLYERYLGVPAWIAHLEDTIFEGLPVDRQKTWPVEFGEAINVGADLDKIKHPFLIFLMEENLKTLDALEFDREEFKDVADSIEQTKKAIELTIKYHRVPNEAAKPAALSAVLSAALSAAKSAAESAAWSAKPAARAAARSASESAAWSVKSAESAAESAWSAAWSARSAAESAESAWSAVWSAVWSARSAEESAAWSVKSAACENYANKLLELMRGAK